MRARAQLLGVLCASIVLAGCGSREYIKEDTWIEDCDTLTQELARIHEGMDKEKVVRILGAESWVLYGMFDDNSVYHQLVVYNYDEDCRKRRGKTTKNSKRRIMFEYTDGRVSRITDKVIN